jgi:Transposase and inactivated derivatives
VGALIERFILGDDQWERLQNLPPGKETNRGATAKDNRLFVEAVFWMARMGAPWRNLPPLQHYIVFYLCANFTAKMSTDSSR